MPVIVITSPASPADESLSASEGRIDAAQLAARPLQRPADLLEKIPGFIASQHSGEGKANQYYLRGFNLDHGTDFALNVDGMPVNQPSHAHGQGYLDMNFLIPETVEQISYRKGVYHVEEGDFSAAGAARIRLANQLAPALSLTRGQEGYQRALALGGGQRGGLSWLSAVEVLANDGPWTVAQDLRKLNGLLRISREEGGRQDSLTLMSYRARWRSTDQVPLRALEDGRLGRFDSVDATDGGASTRHSLSWQHRDVTAEGERRLNAYVIGSTLALRSNFTYFLDDPVNGDQFEQAESRLTVGGGASTRRTLVLPWGRDATITVGMDWRHDRLSPVGLYPAVAGNRTGVVQESRIRQDGLGLYAQQAIPLRPDLRLVTGLRGDLVAARVDASVPDNSGRRTAAVASPKASLIWSATSRTTVFLNGGHGFHSNDARGMTARRDPLTGAAVDAAPPLVRTRGLELGWQHQLPGRGSLAATAWLLDLDSELVFSGDAGTTEARGASRRKGIEFSAQHRLTSWLRLEGDAAWSSARFRSDQGDPGSEGRRVPGSLGRVFSAALVLADAGPWETSLRLRHVGPAPLIEDGSASSRGTTLTSLRAGYRWRGGLRAALDVFNLFDRAASDIDYYYTSRLPGEPAAGVADHHLHPVEPRQLRLTLTQPL